MLIIGNKPYSNLNLTPLLDSYVENTRCNMSLPNTNNGTITDRWALCNHLYENVITKKTKIEGFKKIYHMYDMSKIDTFFKEKNNYISKYNKIYHAVNNKKQKYNEYLKSLECPYKFSLLPRTGYVAMFDNLIAGKKVSIFGFSIKDEQRRSYYVQSGKEENTACHSKSEELNIIKWLHKNGTIDASLCLLEDNTIPTFDFSELKPSAEVLDKVEKIYGKFETIY